MGGLFSLTGLNSADEGVDVDEISAGLSKIIQDTHDTLSKMLRTAMGRPDKNGDYHYDDLPTFGRFGDTPVAKFFMNGFWLLDNDSDAVFDALESVAEGVKSATAHLILKNAGFVLAVDKTKESEDDCKAKGLVWMKVPGDKDSHCMYLAKEDNNYPQAKEDIFKSMEKYALGDRRVYYGEILKCAVSDIEDKDKPNLGSLNIGEVPECQFGMKAVYLSRNKEYSENDCGLGHASGSACDKYNVEDIE